MIRPAAFALATLLCSTISAVASAQPASSIDPPKPSPDKVEPAPSASAKPPPRDAGASFQLHLGALVPLGNLGKDASTQDLITRAYSAELRLAMYPTKHVGITVGAAVDAYSGACDDAKDCGGVGYRIPIGVELALQSRLAGPFAALSVNVLSGVSAFDHGDSATFRANLHEGELAFGWRIPFGPARSAFVPRLGVIVGEYDDAMFNLVGAQGMDGSIPSENRALHYSVALYAGYHFGS
jgi:hypothetical protein